MFKLLVISALLAIGYTSASDLDTFAGGWKVAQIWPAQSVEDKTCETMEIEILNTTTTCGDKTYPLIKLDVEEEAVTFPAVIVKSHEEVADALKIECEGYRVFIIRRLNENYWTQNTGTPEEHITVLWAKIVPTKVELDEFVSKVHGLKEEPGSSICTQEELSSGAQLTSAKKAGLTFLSSKKTGTHV